MSLSISSFTGKLNGPVQTGQNQKPSKEHSQSGPNFAKDIDANKEATGFADTAVLDQISFSTDHKVDYKVNPETNEVVIRVVDRESGEIVRQIPGEDFLKLTQRIAEFNQKYLDETV